MTSKPAGVIGDSEAEGEIYISTEQAAEVLRIPPAAVAAWAKRGILVARRSQGGRVEIAYASAVEIVWLAGELNVAVEDAPRLNPLLVGALKLAAERGAITLAELRGALGIDYAQALALLRKLQRRELLGERQADGRHRYLGAAD